MLCLAVLVVTILADVLSGLGGVGQGWKLGELGTALVALGSGLLKICL